MACWGGVLGSTRKALRARCWGEVGSHVPPADTCPLQTGDTATSNEQALTVRTRRRGPAAAVASCTCLGPSGRSVGRSVGLLVRWRRRPSARPLQAPPMDQGGRLTLYKPVHRLRRQLFRLGKRSSGPEMSMLVVLFFGDFFF